MSDLDTLNLMELQKLLYEKGIHISIKCSENQCIIEIAKHTDSTCDSVGQKQYPFFAFVYPIQSILDTSEYGKSLPEILREPAHIYLYKTPNKYIPYKGDISIFDLPHTQRLIETPGNTKYSKKRKIYRNKTFRKYVSIPKNNVIPPNRLQIPSRRLKIQPYTRKQRIYKNKSLRH